ncbi:MAG: ABC transporter substrate-binding protein [Elusimicrobia bacterium]|nr:ABC transporter substrate-binding protein [Elusimicrobiota bacterium]
MVFRHGNISGAKGAFRDILARFGEAEGVEVRGEPLPMDAGQQHQLYAVNLQGGSEAFDVLAIDIVWIAEFARAGWLADLSQEWPARERRAFLPGTVEAAVYGGRAWAVPWFTDAGMLYYRKDLLSRHGLKPPTTWRELSEAALRVLGAERDPKLSGFVWQGRQYEGLVCNALEYVRSNGTRLLSPDGRWVADPARLAEALGFMSGLMKSGVTPRSALAADEESARHAFGNGNAVFMRNWPYAYALFSKPGSEIAGRFGVTALPRFDGGESSPTLGGWFLAVNRRSKRPELAARFARYMASEAVQREMFESFSLLPTRAGLYREPELVRKAPQLAAFRAGLAAAKPRPVTPFYASLSDILQSEISGVLAGLKTPARAVRDIEIQMGPIEQLPR